MGGDIYDDCVITDSQERVAQVSKCEWINRKYGSSVMTNYLLIKVPNGLHLEKHVSGVNPQEGINFFDTPEEKLEKIKRLYENILGRIAAQDTINELELTFVSEGEAKEILSQLDKTRPYDH